MFYKFLTLLPVISARFAMELKAFVCYLSACHIHADMEIWSSDLRNPCHCSAWLLIRWSITFTIFMATRCWNGTIKSWALQTYKPMLMLSQLKGRHYQIALDLLMARWGLYPGLENTREFYTMGTKGYMPFKFQSVALPNGLIGNLYGPVDKLKKAHLFQDSFMNATTCTSLLSLPS